MVSSHIVGLDLKPLPDRLDIKFFSYTENQFYHGVFELPYERILSLFSEGSLNKEDPTYYRIMVGVRSEEHTSELQSRGHLVCRLLLEKKKKIKEVQI